jgi:hypothetical protein
MEDLSIEIMHLCTFCEIGAPAEFERIARDCDLGRNRRGEKRKELS